MKKLLALILALTMVLALAACGSSAPNETEAPTETPTEAPTEAPAEEVEVPAFAIYTFVEDRGDLQVTWTLTIMGEVYSLEEYNSMAGESTVHGLNECVVDEEAGTITTGAWSDTDSNKSEFFGPDGSCTWVILTDGSTGEGTFEPANLDEVSSEDDGGVNPGKYAIDDTGWNLMLKGSFEYALQEGEGDQLAGASWTDNGDGTITTSALDDPSAAPEWVGDGSGIWTVNEDGTVSFVGEG